MRYLKLIILLLVIYFSKCFFSAEVGKHIYLHHNIQNDLKIILNEAIKEAIPGVSNIQFESVWTENISKKHIRAFFSYKFSDNSKEIPIDLQMTGSAHILKLSANRWSLENIEIEQESLEFTEPLIIEVNLDNETN